MTDVQIHLERLATVPGEPDALAAVEQAYSSAGRWEELLRIYEDNARRSEGDTDLLRKAAQVCLQELSSASRAEAYLKRAIEALPSSIESLRALRELYQARGDYNACADVYEQELARTTDPAEKAEGLVALAEIYRDHLVRLDRALTSAKQAVRVDKHNAVAYRIQSSVYERQGRLGQAYAALVKELDVAGLTDDILGRMGQMAQGLLERPKLHDKASEAAATVLRHRPGDALAQGVQAEIDAFRTSWPGRVADLEQRATQSQRANPDNAANLWVSVAEVRLVYGEQIEEALMAIDRAMAAHPGHPIALRLMEELYGVEDRWEDLATKIEMMAGYARDPATAVHLFLKAAMHHAVRLDDAETAARLYARVLEVEPGHKVASNALAEFYRDRKDWESALKVLSGWAERATNAADKVAGHYACSRILAEELQDRVRARPHYEAILELDPENQAAARALEGVYRESGDHAALTRVLHAKLAGLHEADRLPVLQELAALHESVDPHQALQTLGELYQLQPTAALLEQLEELAARAGDFLSLATFIEGALNRIEVQADRVQALHSLASLYEGAREAPVEALRVHRRILLLEPNDERAKSAVERLIEVAAESGDKVSFYEEQYEAATDSAEKVGILNKLARELVDTVRDYHRAAGVYQTALQLDPSDITALDGLLALYRRDQRWAVVADMLGRKLELMTPGTMRLEVRLELAGILAGHLDQIEAAVDHYIAVLAGDEPAPKLTAKAGLEHLLSRTTRPAVVAYALEPLYVDAHEWPKAAEMAEIRVREEADLDTRVALLRDLSRIYAERLSQPAEALAALQRAFQAAPHAHGLADDLEQAAEVAGNFGGVVRLYRAAAIGAEQPIQRDFRMRAATLAARSGDIEGAMGDYLQAVQPQHEMENDSAFSGLATLLQQGAEPSTLIHLAQQVVAALKSDESQYVLMLRRLAQFYEGTMESKNDAVDAWKGILAINAQDPEALAQVDRLLESAEDPTQLVEHLRTQMATALDDGKVAIGLKLVAILNGKMNDSAQAVEILNGLTDIAASDRRVWQALTHSYRQAGQPQGAADAMLKELNLLPEGDERRKALVAYASVLGRELGDVAGAVAALQGVFTADAGNADGVLLLEGLMGATQDLEQRKLIISLLQEGYRAAERWAELRTLLNNALIDLQDPAERVDVLREVAQISADRLDDVAGAYGELENAFREAPLNAGLRLDLEKMAERASAWQQLATAYEAALGVIDSPEDQRPIRRKLAEVLDSRLGRGAEAVAHYRAAGGGQLPDDLPSLQAMERLLREQQNFADLVEVLGAMAAQVADDDQKKTLLSEMAMLCREQLADKGRAVEVLREVIALGVPDPLPLHELDTLLSELGQETDRESVLNALVELGTRNPEQIDDYVKLAAVQAGLEKYDDAFTSYRSILLKRREQPEAIAGLEELLPKTSNRLEVAQVLEPIYTAKQDYEKLAWVLQQKLEGTEELVQRKGLLRRIGDIYENRLGQKDRAFQMARRSLGEDPSDMGVRMWIEKLAGETGALAEMAQAYVDEAGRADAPLNVQFHRRAAAIYQDKIDDPLAAVEQYRAILAIEERDEKSLTGLEAIFRTTENYAELVGILRKRYELTAGVERKRDYLTEISTIYAERLGDLDRAVETQREILVISPDDPHPFTEIERLLSAAGQWDELVRTYDAEEKRLAEKRGRDVQSRRQELMFRRGKIIDEQFGDFVQARDVFAAVLAEDPTHENTLNYLETRAAQGVAEYFDLLENIYTENSHWQKYVDLLRKKLELTAETAMRRVIYVELARVYADELNVGDLAFQALVQAFSENRADLDLLDKLETSAAANSFWAELVQVLGTDVDAIPDVALRQTVLRKLGHISGMHLNNVEGAVGYLNRALQNQPGDPETLGTLDGLLQKNQMWAALADVLEQRVAVATEASEKSQFLERLAVVWGENLMDAEAALRCHQQIMEIDPDHPISLRQMQKLYAEVQDWDALAKNLERQATVFEEPEEQIRVHAAAGTLFAEELGDMDAAIVHWQKVAELDPTHEDANDALNVLLRTEERWEELASHMQRRLANTQDRTAKLEINQHLGVILGEKLGRGDDALASWLQVLEEDDKNTDAMRALLDLYRERALWPDFVDISERLAALAEPAEAKQVRFEMAKVLGENLGERERAIKLAREVRAQEPHTSAEMVALADTLENIEAYEDAVIAAEKAAALAENADERVAQWLRAALMHSEKIGKPDDARVAYEAVLNDRPADVDAFLALAQIYRNQEEWRALVVLDEEFVPHADSALRLQILVEIRDVQYDKLGEKELAFITACRVYKEDPTDLESAVLLERIALETDGAEEAAAVLEDELERIDDDALRVELLRRVARIYSEEVKDSHTAEQILNQILELDSSDLGALDRLAALGSSEERYDKQILALERKFQQVTDDADRKTILFEIARIWEDRIGETDEALDALNRVLEIDGSDIAALDTLGRLYEEESRWTELAHVLTRKVELSQNSEENIGLRIRVAQLCEGELADQEAAIQWYRGVLDFENGHHGALSALDRLYTGLERWSELLQVFELQIGHAEQNEDKLSLLAKMASIYEAEFNAPQEASQCYERCVELESNHLASLKNLERLLRILGSWPRLIEIIEHHISLLNDPAEVTSLYLQMGDIYHRELSRVDKAEHAYSMARDTNPASDEALHALGKLYERSGNWFQSLEMMQREADAMGHEEGALPILMRIGRINEDMLMDMSAAQGAYQRALEIDPTYGPALQAMKEIAKGAENWDAYSEHLLAEAETTDDLEEKTDLFVEAANYFLNVRDDEMSAIRYFQRALETTPGHVGTSGALAEIYFRNEMWEEAGELYDVVVATLDKSADAKEFCQKHYRLGYIHERSGDDERSLEHYRQAFEADATYLPALEGLGQALLKMSAWEEAQKVFQTILIHHRDSLTESEVVDVQSQLADICLQQGQPDRAYGQFEKALEIDPDHPGALAALAKLDESMGNFEGAFMRLSRLSDVAPGPERVEALLRMSVLAIDQLGDIAKGIEPLERARRLGSASAEVLSRLADLYLQTHQAPRAVEVLEEAAGLASDPQQASDLNFHLAMVYEKEIRHEPLAVQKYNAALDAAPTNFQAFEAIERILGSRQEWALLEENYRAMIARSKELSLQIRLVLWHSLAELYHKVLASVDNAIMAYEVIAKMDPDNAADQSILADLYGQKPEKRAEAIAMQHDLMQQQESPVAAIKSLRKLYHADQNFDAVYCMCGALIFMNSADDEEKQVLQYLLRGVPPQGQGALREDSWALLRHPGLDNVIGKTVVELYRVAREHFMFPIKQHGLKKKDYVDCRNSDLWFANWVRYAAKMLNLPMTDLYRRSGSMEPAHAANTQPPSLIVGENNELFRNPSFVNVTRFQVGRAIAYARPDMFLPRVFPGEEFRDMLFGLCYLFNRNLQHPGHPGTVERWATVLQRVPQQGLRRLAPMVEPMYKAIIQVGPLNEYLSAVEYTANRAGLLVAGDLNAAHRGITEGDEGTSSVPVNERIKELVLFATSPQYLQARKLVGSALVTGANG